MDNGKVKIYLFDGIPVGEIYHDGELEDKDISWMHEQILRLTNEMPCNLIINKVGKYSLTGTAQEKIKECMHDHKRVAFVVHHPMQKTITKFAAISYLAGHEIKEFSDIKCAHKWLLSF